MNERQPMIGSRRHGGSIEGGRMSRADKSTGDPVIAVTLICLPCHRGGRRSPLAPPFRVDNRIPTPSTEVERPAGEVAVFSDVFGVEDAVWRSADGGHFSITLTCPTGHRPKINGASLQRIAQHERQRHPRGTPVEVDLPWA